MHIEHHRELLLLKAKATDRQLVQMSKELNCTLAADMVSVYHICCLHHFLFNRGFDYLTSTIFQAFVFSREHLDFIRQIEDMLS